LDPVAKEGWITVTQDWIRNASIQYISSGNGDDGTANELGSEDERSMDVTISLNQYQVVEDEDATTTNRSRMMLSRYKKIGTTSSNDSADRKTRPKKPRID
jgi:hypothetical protein